jgi:hypothetical protein
MQFPVANGFDLKKKQLEPRNTQTTREQNGFRENGRLTMNSFSFVTPVFQPARRADWKVGVMENGLFGSTPFPCAYLAFFAVELPDLGSPGSVPIRPDRGFGQP